MPNDLRYASDETVAEERDEDAEPEGLAMTMWWRAAAEWMEEEGWRSEVLWRCCVGKMEGWRSEALLEMLCGEDGRMQDGSLQMGKVKKDGRQQCKQLWENWLGGTIDRV